jgi:hypothetical protein
MVAKNPMAPVARELEALTRWVSRRWAHRPWASRPGTSGGWRDYHPVGGDVPLPPTPHVDLYRDRDKLVLTPERARE